jgi:hypothetical protein
MVFLFLRVWLGEGRGKKDSVFEFRGVYLSHVMWIYNYATTYASEVKNRSRFVEGSITTGL